MTNTATEVYVLMGAKDGVTHASMAHRMAGCIDGNFSTVCGRDVGDRWVTGARSYRSRSITRKRVTCERCRKALAGRNAA